MAYFDTRGAAGTDGLSPEQERVVLYWDEDTWVPGLRGGMGVLIRIFTGIATLYASLHSFLVARNITSTELPDAWEECSLGTVWPWTEEVWDRDTVPVACAGGNMTKAS